jgi:hypothetical protein
VQPSETIGDMSHVVPCPECAVTLVGIFAHGINDNISSFNCLNCVNKSFTVSCTSLVSLLLLYFVCLDLLEVLNSSGGSCDRLLHILSDLGHILI